MQTIVMECLILCEFKAEDEEELFELLPQRAYDEFEEYSGIARENGREHLKDRMDPKEF